MNIGHSLKVSWSELHSKRVNIHLFGGKLTPRYLESRYICLRYDKRRTFGYRRDITDNFTISRYLWDIDILDRYHIHITVISPCCVKRSLSFRRVSDMVRPRLKRKNHRVSAVRYSLLSLSLSLFSSI